MGCELELAPTRMDRESEFPPTADAEGPMPRAEIDGAGIGVPFYGITKCLW